MPIVTEKSEPKEGDEYTLHLVFAHGLQYEVYVTKFEPQYDASGLIARAEIEQNSLLPGDQVIAHIDWGQVVFAAVSWDPERVRG
jgi:hypothetical protein